MSERTITVIRETGQIDEMLVPSKDVSIVMDDETIFEPRIVHRIEYDHQGGMSKIKYENCIHTENRRESDDKPEITINGIITKPQLDDMKQLQFQSNPSLASDVYSGPIVCSRLTIEQNSNIVEYIPDGGEPELAFDFQLQVLESQYHDSVATPSFESSPFAVDDDSDSGPTYADATRAVR